MPILSNTKKKVYRILKQDAEIYGLSIFGDGATIKKLPLINCIASGAHNPCAVLEIFDCSESLQVGQKKDASFICNLFKPKMEEIDPRKELFDAIFFDGAGNVQNAGHLLKLDFPRTTVMHGAEHVMSLFFKDVAKIPQVKNVIKYYKNIYQLLGSGAHHLPYAMFHMHCKELNGGRDIGLIKAADTRFAGYFIALLRYLRLFEAIKACLNSIKFQEYISGNGNRLSQKVRDAADVVGTKGFQRAVQFIVEPMKPALKLLRMADTNTPAMDKLLYLLRCTTHALEKFQGELNSTDVFDNLEETEEADDVIESHLESGNDSLDEGTEIDEFDDDLTSNCDSNLLGDQILHHWKKRSKTICHEYAIGGWYCSIDPNVRKDVEIMESKFQTASYRIKFEELIQHLISHMPDERRNQFVEKFWDQWDAFHNRTGEFFGHQHIWCDSHIFAREIL